ncbi:hypothetical protein FS837_010991 [Tulasnella sp. UAMH 9824]|nr:hypothetical protein FS837_010991 [Tulasnella sp. UAMH 9824]
MSSSNRTPCEDNIQTVVGTTGGDLTTSDDIEQQPLLGKGKEQRTPLPVAQLSILCLVRLAEPITYTQIFPYVNAMIEELHVTDNPADIRFYSCLVLFRLRGAFWAIGAIIGPLIDGTLSNPSERYPELFGNCDFLKDRNLDDKFDSSTSRPFCEHITNLRRDPST